MGAAFVKMLWVFQFVALSLVGCIQARTAYITNGEDVPVPGMYPWQVSVQILGKHNCGAAIISNYWVISAAHCFRPLPTSHFTVVAGAHDLTFKYGKPVTHRVAEIINHPGWDFEVGQDG